MLSPPAEIQITKKEFFFQGLKSGIPVAIGYLPIAITFGLLANNSSIPIDASLMMSLFVYAGASQFIAVNLLAAGAAHFEIILTTLILNLRHFFMSASLSQRIAEPTSKGLNAVLSFGITDETFSVASLQESRQLHPLYLLGLNSVSFLAWNAGTWIGIFVSLSLPPSLQSSLGIALYAMFVGLLVPSLKKSRPVVWITLIAIAIHSAIVYIMPLFVEWSAGWSIIVTTLLTSALGVFIFPEKGETAFDEPDK